MKKYTLAVVAAITVLSIAGCGGKETKAPEQTTAAETTVTEAASKKEDDAAATEAALFAGDVAVAVKTKDLDALIKMSAFPVYISSVKTNDGVVESVEEFGEVEPATIFTDPFVKAITSFDLSKLEKTKAGYVLGEGTPNVIFTEADGSFKITGINVE
ncbi:MAG: hypothetical protein RR768_05335 [Clostridium sp.]